MPCAVQRATAADVPYSMSSGCATTQSTRWKDSSGRAGNVMPAILPELFPVSDGQAGRVQLAPARADLRPVAADDPGHIAHSLSQLGARSPHVTVIPGAGWVHADHRSRSNEIRSESEQLR